MLQLQAVFRPTKLCEKTRFAWGFLDLYGLNGFISDIFSSFLSKIPQQIDILYDFSGGKVSQC